MTISYRDQFNNLAETSEGVLNDRKLSKLDAEFATAAVMGVLDVENGSISGRMATGAAVQKEQHDIREKRKREDAEIIRIITHFRDTLTAIDKRLAALDEDIAALRIDLTEAEQESQKAFDRMHELEAVLSEVDADGFTDPRRERLRGAIGPEADKARDDDTLRLMAEERIEEERQTGTTAFERAEDIRKQIEVKSAARTKLAQDKQDTLSNPNLSAEEKAIRLQASLDQSLASDTDAAEMERSAEVRVGASSSLDEDLTVETEDSDFDFDEGQEITIPPRPDTPGMG